MQGQDDKETAALEVEKPIFIPKIDCLGILSSLQSNRYMYQAITKRSHCT